MASEPNRMMDETMQVTSSTTCVSAQDNFIQNTLSQKKWSI